MLDFSSAFDCVHQGKLLEKIRCAGIKDSAHSILASYLIKRFQQIRCNEVLSSKTEVRCGVTQGGSLSALLFSLYIDDLLNDNFGETGYLGYADDISLTFSFDGPIDWSLVEGAVERVFEWSRQNGLLLN